MRLLFFILFLLQLVVAQGQIKRVGIPFIRNFYADEYKASPQNWCIDQDDRGIMFIGNNYGLLIFDGTYWNKLELPNRTIFRSVKYHENGRLFVGGQSELGYFYPNENGQWKYYSLKSIIPKGFENFTDVWSIFFIGDNIVYHTNEGFYNYNGKSIKVNGAKQVYAKTFNFNDKTYFVTKNEGLQYLFKDSIYKAKYARQFKGIYATAMLKFNDNRFLFGTLRNGLFILENNQLKPWNIEVNDFLKNNQVYCAIQFDISENETGFLNQRYFAFGTIQNGVVIIDANGNVIQHINKAKGLQNNTVLSMFFDQSENLWLALDNGLTMIEITSPFSYLQEEMGFPGTCYDFEKKGNYVYAGTNQGVFYKHESELYNDIYSNRNLNLIKGTEGQTWGLQTINNNLFCAHHEGTFCIKDRKATKVADIMGSWKLMQMPNNNILIGSYYGLSLFSSNINSKNFCKDSLPYKDLKSFNESARVMELENDSLLWVSHGYKGVYKVDLKKDNSIKAVTFYDKAKGLPKSILNNVFKINNEIVFGTRYGAYKYQAKKDTFVLHQELTEIFNGFDFQLRTMKQDKYGNIWYLIDGDLGFMYKDKQGNYQRFEKDFKRIEGQMVFGFELIKVLSNEDVFIGTYDGLVHYNPSIKLKNTSLFNTIIRKIQITGNIDSTLYFGADRHVAKSNNYKIPFENNALRFQYSATFYQALSENKYKYILKGYDNDWSDWSYRAEKEYTNLPEGKYTFKVKAINKYDQESEATQFSFEILPPWYRTIYAYSFYILSFILTVFGAVLFFYRKFEKQKSQAIEEKTQEIKQKEDHFIKESKRSEEQIILLKNQKLEAEVARQNAENAQQTSELASIALRITHKNEMLSQLKHNITLVSKNVNEQAQKELIAVINKIEADLESYEDWENFEKYFDRVHADFIKRLKDEFPELTPKELKLCAYLRLNIGTKEIASLLNITISGVEKSRYRIRRKLNLERDDNLVEFIISY